MELQALLFLLLLSLLSREIAGGARGKSELSSTASRGGHTQKSGEKYTGCVNGSEEVDGQNNAHYQRHTNQETGKTKELSFSLTGTH